MLKQVLAIGIRLTLLPTAMREIKQKREVTVILYHNPSHSTFKKHMEHLRKNYNFVSLEKAVTGKNLPSKPLVVTLDDGHKRNYELLETMKKQEIPVTIFASSNPEGARKNLENQPLLSKKEILELQENGVSFQSHTRNHAILPKRTDEEAKNELEGSKKELEEKTGKKVWCIAYPNGDYSKRIMELTEKAGYTHAFTTDPGFNTPKTNPYAMKRICIDDTDTINVLAVKVTSIWQRAKEVLKKRESGYTTGDEKK